MSDDKTLVPKRKWRNLRARARRVLGGLSPEGRKSWHAHAILDCLYLNGRGCYSEKLYRRLVNELDGKEGSAE